MNILHRNNVSILGEGTKPIIFAHGFGCSQHMWRHIWPAFEKEYKIILFDYVGSGQSDISAYSQDRYNNINGYAQDVLDICSELNLKDAIFVGHSVSGMIGLLSAIKAPELFDDLIMIGPSPRYINDDNYIGGFESSDIKELLMTMEQNYIGWANFLGHTIMQNEDRPELGEEMVESFCSTDPVIARQFAEVTFFSDNRADLKHVKHRALIMQCSQDLIAPESVGNYLADHLGNATYVRMEATGHCPHLSAPEETIQLIQHYLKSRN